MGYSPCILANFGHFQNALIFRILGVFGSGFLHPTTLMWSYIHFSHLFGIAHAYRPILAIFLIFSQLCGIFNFLAKLSPCIFHGLQPMHIGQFWPFSKCSHFSNIRCFSERHIGQFWPFSKCSHFSNIRFFRTFVFRTQQL